MTLRYGTIGQGLESYVVMKQEEPSDKRISGKYIVFSVQLQVLVSELPWKLREAR